MELLLEAQQFATYLSNLKRDTDPAFTTEKKVNISLVLADLTLDVNHVLGALIYLLQSVQKDFETLVHGQPTEGPVAASFAQLSEESLAQELEKLGGYFDISQVLTNEKRRLIG